MATLLIFALPDDRAPDRHPYHLEESKRNSKKGAVIAVKDDPAVWGSADGPPNFVRLTITDRTKAQIEQYRQRWDQVPDFRVDAHSEPLDRYDVTVFATHRRTSDGLGGLTRTKVENYLADWNIPVQSASAGEVAVRFTIFDVMTSRHFWDVDLTNVQFSELSYDRPSGTHVVRADYSAKGWNPAGVEAKVASVATVVAHDTTAKLIDYSLTRDDVLAMLKSAIRADVDGWVAKERWYLDNAQVDAMLAGDGTASMTAAEALPLIRDAVLD